MSEKEESKYQLTVIDAVFAVLLGNALYEIMKFCLDSLFGG